MRHWRGIVVHHTAGRPDATADEIDRVHREERGFKMIGYHYLVRHDVLLARWLVELGRPLTMDGAHCPGANRTHIGVAVAGNYAKSQPPELALSTLVMLLADLCVTHDIETAQIVGHCDRRATECPGAMMMEKLPAIRARVANLLPIVQAI
jgi:hypothetical protein